MTTNIARKFTAKKAVPTRNNISIGDYVRKTNSTDWVWQVIEFVTPTGHQPHARLLCMDHPADVRMFAVAALRDRRLFVNAANRAQSRGMPSAAEVTQLRELN
jgi:hypothetical protein